MKKSYQSYPYEFLFMINGNTIVGRNFNIRNFNRESISSYELKETIDSVVYVIREHFKNNTYDYMEKYSNYYTKAEETDKVSIYDNEDYFTFQLKVKDKVVCEKIFSGNVYQPNVRYDVDIRKIIPKIIDYLQQGLSMENYTKKLYNAYSLVI